MTHEADITGRRRRAIILGASGLVGRECLARLRAIELYSEIRVITRRDLDLGCDDERVQQIVVDFDRLENFADKLTGDDAFCAFGTTIKKAGSQERFREIDLTYPASFARLVRQNGGEHFSLVSSRGAQARSRIFYLRTKGELEDEIRRQAWPSASILRPSVIGGRRRESRPGERIAQSVLRVAPRPLRTVPASAIAATMIRLARDRNPGVLVVESGDITSDDEPGT